MRLCKALPVLLCVLLCSGAYAAGLDEAMRRAEPNAIRQALDAGADINAFLGDGQPSDSGNISGTKRNCSAVAGAGSGCQPGQPAGLKPLDLQKDFRHTALRAIAASSHARKSACVPRESGSAAVPEVKPDPAPAAPAAPAATGNSIVLYGRPGCGLCNALMSRLKQNNIPFTFANIDTDRAAQQKMWGLVRTNFPGQSCQAAHC